MRLARKQGRYRDHEKTIFIPSVKFAKKITLIDKFIIIGDDSMDNIKLSISSDVIGVTLCGIMKNVYALGMGIVDALGTEQNMKACFATRALMEMQLLAGDTVMTYAGVGDFIVTCYSSESRNYTYGYRFVNKKSVDGIMSEGVNNIDALLDYTSVDLPIARAIKSCLMTHNAIPMKTILNQCCALRVHL